MTFAVEQYAEFAVGPDVLWDVIRTPLRLREWTSATPVDPPEQWEVGQHVTVRERDSIEWEVLSAEPRVVEVRGLTPCGGLGIGARVIGSQAGSPTRVVFVARLDAASNLHARLRHLPALRRRFDHWAVGLRRATGG